MTIGIAHTANVAKTCSGSMSDSWFSRVTATDELLLSRTCATRSRLAGRWVRRKKSGRSSYAPKAAGGGDNGYRRSAIISECRGARVILRRLQVKESGVRPYSQPGLRERRQVVLSGIEIT